MSRPSDKPYGEPILGPRGASGIVYTRGWKHSGKPVVINSPARRETKVPKGPSTWRRG